MADRRVIVLLVDTREVGRNIQAVHEDAGYHQRVGIREGMKTTDSPQHAITFPDAKAAKKFLETYGDLLHHYRPFIVPLDGASAVPTVEHVFAS